MLLTNDDELVSPVLTFLDIERADLEERYAEPHRYYHNLSHINRMVGLWNRYASELPDKELLLAAIWYHDAIYDTDRRDNELRSAELFRSRAAADGLLDDEIATVAEMIQATAHSKRDDSASEQEQFLLDFDLEILASDPLEYDKYAHGIAREYAWVEPKLFLEGRTAVLNSFLNRPAIYAHFHQWEDRAHRNIQRELATCRTWAK